MTVFLKFAMASILLTSRINIPVGIHVLFFVNVLQNIEVFLIAFTVIFPRIPHSFSFFCVCRLPDALKSIDEMEKGDLS